MNKLYGLIFDVDGIIADTEPHNAVATIKVFEDMFGVTGVVADDFRAGIGKGAEKYILAAAEIHNVTISDDQLKKAADMRERNIIELFKQNPLPAFPGVLELINAASAVSDFKLAIATSASRELGQAILNSAKVPVEKMAYICGDMVTHKKPDPELFLLAAQAISLAPERTVVVEDAAVGVTAAKTAGTKCIAVTNSLSAAELKNADIICDSLTEIDIEKLRELIDS